MIHISPGKLFQLKFAVNHAWICNEYDFQFYSLHSFYNTYRNEKILGHKDVMLYLGEKKLSENYGLGQFLFKNIILTFRNQSYYKTFLLEWDML